MKLASGWLLPTAFAATAKSSSVGANTVSKETREQK